MADPDANKNPWTLTKMGPLVSNANTDPDSPDYETYECAEMRSKSKTCRNLRKGTRHMLNHAQDYLVQYENEDVEDYKARLGLISFRNFYGQSVRSILGKIFSKPPALNEDVPEQMVAQLKDADLNGNDWTIVVEQLFNNALDEGLSWLLIDYHTTAVAEGQELTIAQERELGVRPYWVNIPQHRVLGVNYTKSGETYSITMFRYWTWTKVRHGEFGDKYVFQVHVIEPNRVRMFERDGDAKGNDTKYRLMKDLPVTLGTVPVVCLNLNPTGPYEASPPLEDLAEMNIEHYQIRSDQRRALSVASYPLLATFGMSQNSSLRVGPMQSYNFEDPKADMKWVESQGAHLREGAKELESLEEKIRMFALSFESPGMYVTATAANTNATDAVAPIIRWAYRLRDSINTVLYHHAKWLRLSEGGTVDVDTSFIKSILTVESLKLLVQAYTEGAITRVTFLTRMKEYGILNDRTDPRKEDQELTSAEDRKKREERATSDRMDTVNPDANQEDLEDSSPN